MGPCREYNARRGTPRISLCPPLRCPTPLPPLFKFLKPQTGRHACTYYLHTNRCLRKPQDVQNVPAPYFLQQLRCLRLATHCARIACALFFTVPAVPAPRYSLCPWCLHLIFYNGCDACASLFTVPGVPAPYCLQHLRCLRLATHCVRGACTFFFTAPLCAVLPAPLPSCSPSVRRKPSPV